MKRSFPIVLIVTLTLMAPALCGDAKDDGKLMQGAWLPATAELAGQKFPDETTKKMKLVLKDDTYVLTLGTVTDRGTIKFDASAKVKTMDISGTEGPNKGKTFLAIYELSDDTLKICYDLSGKARPKEFKTAAETQLFLVVYKREKP